MEMSMEKLAEYLNKLAQEGKVVVEIGEEEFVGVGTVWLNEDGNINIIAEM